MLMWLSVGGYRAIVSYPDGTIIPTNAADRRFLNFNNNNKIRINGIITSLSFYTGIITNSTKLFIQFWRSVDGSYSLIYEEDVYSKISANTVNVVTLTTPYNAQEGDMIGFWAESSVTDALFRGVDAIAGSLLYQNGTKPDTGFDWDSVSKKIAYVIPTKSYGQSPLLVAIGDSIMAGHPTHDSYIEDSITNNKLNSITGQLYILNSKYICQNMGSGGQTSTDIKNRFTADVIDLKPKIAIIQGGVNDISKGDITKATFISNYTTMLNACETAGIIPVVLKILPWTNGTNDQMQDRDEWMTDLEALVATYAGSVWVDFDIDMGKFRVGGDADNLWDLQTTPDYDQDGVHPTLLGYTKMAEVIDREIKKKYDFS